MPPFCRVGMDPARPGPLGGNGPHWHRRTLSLSRTRSDSASCSESGRCIPRQIYFCLTPPRSLLWLGRPSAVGLQTRPLCDRESPGAGGDRTRVLNCVHLHIFNHSHCDSDSGNPACYLGRRPSRMYRRQVVFRYLRARPPFGAASLSHSALREPPDGIAPGPAQCA